MKNNKGFGTKETMIVILLILVVMAVLMYTTLGGASAQKIKTLKEDGLTFAKAIINNQNTFKNTNKIYLGEAVSEGVMKSIKNPLGSGNCDESESKVVFENGHVYTTLKCGDYLIDNYEIKNLDDVPVYVVSKWSEKKPSGNDVEEATLYNASEGSSLVFDNYYEDGYLVFKVNDKYNESCRTIDAIERKTALTVTSKKFYRTKELYDKK